MKSVSVLLTMVTAAILFVAAGLPALTHAQGADAALAVSDYGVPEGASELIVDSATLPVDGYVVVHEGDATSFGAVIGSSELLSAGSYDALVVSLDRPIQDGEYLWPMLHSEDNGNGMYDDAATDAPIVDAVGGNPDFGGVVTFPLQLTIQPPDPSSQSGPGAADTGHGQLSGGYSLVPGALATLLLGALLVIARRATHPRSMKS